MTSHDSDLAQRLDGIAPQVGQRLDDVAGAAETVTAAADRLRAIAQLPAGTLPPPPIVPTKLAPVPEGAFEHTLETIDGVADGFHHVGRMPRRNAKLDKPKESGSRDYRIFTDPRLAKHK